MRRIVFLSALSLFVPAHAATWLCGLSEDATRIVCVADDAPSPVADAAPAATATVNGTRFPLDTGRRWVVDFWSPATDLDRVEQLARATICYRSPGCEVVFSARPAAAPRKPA